MQKTAQKRSILNKLREMTNVSGIAAEKFFNPEFQRVMESLREKDDQIRSLVAGEAIGMGDPGNDSIALKDLLKSSKSNLNRREYMSAIADLGRFHKKLFDVVQEISKLSFDVDQVHHEFLFKDLDDEKKQHLHDLKSRFAHNRRMEMIKEASVMDFFYNIGTKRGRALAAWEKRYPKQVGKLKKDTAVLQSRSEALLQQVLSALKEMASARSTRNVDAYTKAADKITKSYQGYDKSFRDYYTANVKGFLEKVELISPTEKLDKKQTKEMGGQEVATDGVPDTEKMPDPAEQAKAFEYKEMRRRQGLTPKEIAEELAAGKGPSTIPASPLPQIWDKSPNGPTGTIPAGPLSEHSEPLPLVQRKAPNIPSLVPPTDRTGPPSRMSDPALSPTMLSPGQPGAPAPSIPSAPAVPAISQPDYGGSGVVPPSNPPSRHTQMYGSEFLGGGAPGTQMGVAPPANAPGGFKSDQIAREMGYNVESTAHSKFYAALESLSGESPELLASFIAKYARKIQATDPETSIELLQIVKRIKG